MSKYNRTDYRQQQNQRAENDSNRNNANVASEEAVKEEAAAEQQGQDSGVADTTTPDQEQNQQDSGRGNTQVFRPIDEPAMVKDPEPQQQQPQQKQPTNSYKEKNVVVIEQQLVSYIENVTPSKANTPALLGQWQKSLFQLLLMVLSHQDPAVFRKEWTTVLNVANKNREGVFHENYIFRAPQHWNLSDQEATLFRRVLSVILETADPETRQNVSNRVLLERATQGMTEVAKNNFLNYYA